MWAGRSVGGVLLSLLTTVNLSAANYSTRISGSTSSTGATPSSNVIVLTPRTFVSRTGTSAADFLLSIHASGRCTRNRLTNTQRLSCLGARTFSTNVGRLSGSHACCVCYEDKGQDRNTYLGVGGRNFGMCSVRKNVLG